MSKRPCSVFSIGLLFLAVGLGGFIHQVVEWRATGGFRQDRIWVLLVDSLAILGALFLFRAANWARWLLLAWMAFHVVVSAFHPLRELIIHALFLVALAYFLFRPPASLYFRKPNQPA
jgi:hypothetical protein